MEMFLNLFMAMFAIKFRSLPDSMSFSKVAKICRSVLARGMLSTLNAILFSILANEYVSVNLQESDKKVSIKNLFARKWVSLLSYSAS